MSTLAKVFVVLLVVFSIAFTMSTVSYVVKDSNWKGVATDYRTYAQNVDAHLRNQAASFAAEKAGWLTARDTLQSRIDKLEQDLMDRAQKQADLNAENVQLQTARREADAVIAQLTSELQVAQSGWVELQKQRDDMETRTIEVEKRNVDLNERNKELMAQQVVLVQQTKQLEQQINQLRNEASGTVRVHAGDMGPGLTGVKPMTPASAVPIRGKLLKVDDNLASISVGSADGVEKGMLFVIYRNNEYVGDLRITAVQPDNSAGEISFANITPVEGDSVAEETTLGKME